MSEPKETSGHTVSGTNNHISAPRLVVQIDGSAKTILIAIGVLIIVLLSTVPVAIGAQTKANAADKAEDKFEERINDRVIRAETESRQAAFWVEEASASCAAQGVRVPPNPFEKGR